MLKKARAPVIFCVLLLAIWEFAVRVLALPAYVLPPPSAVFLSLLRDFPLFWPHIGATVLSAGIGLLLSAAVSIALGILMDAIAPLKRTLYPLLILSQTVPLVVIAPLLILYMGFGMMPKVVIVMLMCFFPIVVGLVQGLGQSDERMLGLLRSMGAKPAGIYRLVKFPGAMPAFFAGLRIAATYCVMGAVIGEWMGAEKGMGFLMMRLKNAYALDKVFALIVIISVVSLIFVGLARLLESICMPWKRLPELTPDDVMQNS